MKVVNQKKVFGLLFLCQAAASLDANLEKLFL